MTLRLRARQALGEICCRFGGRRPLPNSLSVLMYHAVTLEDLQDAEQQSVSLQRFSDQMEALHRMGRRCVPLEEGLHLLGGDAECGAMVSVVFDDGYVGVHDLASEVLVRYRIPATLFLATGQIGQSSFSGSSSRLGRPLIWEEVSRLTRQAGCAVGSHGHSHRALTRLSSEEARRELKASRTLIEDQLRQPCRLFAYPYGARGTFDAGTERMLREEGFTVACTSVWGRCLPGTNPLSVPRMRVSWCDTPHEIEKSLEGCYDWYRFFQRIALK